MLSQQDPIAASAEDHAEVSIAARGFYAMELLLFDETPMTSASADYHCQLVQTTSADIAAVSRAIHEDWQSNYAALMLSPTDEGTYRSDNEVLQQVLNSLSTGLEFTAETRLGRPLGTFDCARHSEPSIASGFGPSVGWRRR